MAASQQKQWLADLMEGLPSVVFILLWRQGVGLEPAGWAGAGTALAVFLLISILKCPMHPVLLGVNVHILLATPLIVGLFHIGADPVAEVMASHAYSGVLLTVLGVGIGLSLFSKGGFPGVPKLPAPVRWRISALMLAVAAVGANWALTATGSGLLPVVVTLTSLIAARRFLLARWSDNSNSGAGLVLAGVSDSQPQPADLSA